MEGMCVPVTCVNRHHAANSGRATNVIALADGELEASGSQSLAGNIRQPYHILADPIGGYEAQ